METQSLCFKYPYEVKIYPVTYIEIFDIVKKFENIFTGFLYGNVSNKIKKDLDMQIINTFTTFYSKLENWRAELLYKTKKDPYIEILDIVEKYDHFKRLRFDVLCKIQEKSDREIIKQIFKEFYLNLADWRAKILDNPTKDFYIEILDIVGKIEDKVRHFYSSVLHKIEEEFNILIIDTLTEFYLNLGNWRAKLLYKTKKDAYIEILDIVKKFEDQVRHLYANLPSKIKTCLDMQTINTFTKFYLNLEDWHDMLIIDTPTENECFHFLYEIKKDPAIFIEMYCKNILGKSLPVDLTTIIKSYINEYKHKNFKYNPCDISFNNSSSFITNNKEIFGSGNWNSVILSKNYAANNTDFYILGTLNSIIFNISEKIERFEINEIEEIVQNLVSFSLFLSNKTQVPNYTKCAIEQTKRKFKPYSIKRFPGVHNHIKIELPKGDAWYLKHSTRGLDDYVLVKKLEKYDLKINFNKVWKNNASTLPFFVDYNNALKKFCDDNKLKPLFISPQIEIVHSYYEKSSAFMNSRKLDIIYKQSSNYVFEKIEYKDACYHFLNEKEYINENDDDFSLKCKKAINPWCIVILLLTNGLEKFNRNSILDPYLNIPITTI